MGNCPDCDFSGNADFPQGYATENHQKLKDVKNKFKETLQIPDLDKNGRPQFVKIHRCPLCGYIEGRPLTRKSEIKKKEIEGYELNRSAEFWNFPVHGSLIQVNCL